MNSKKYNLNKFLSYSRSKDYIENNLIHQNQYPPIVLFFSILTHFEFTK